MFFQKKSRTNVDPSICNPIIVNQTNHSIVVFQDRGVLYNKQVLEPGEAVGMSRKETAGGSIVPYQIHALVGDERDLPSRTQSMKNLLSAAIIPTAFVVGTIAAASSAGTLAGPSTALGRAASGIVVRGIVIDSTAVAAGSLVANRASALAEMLIEKHPENFMAKSGRFMPGENYIIVRGGIDKALKISQISERDFRRISINGEVKTPTDTLQDQIKYYLPSMLQNKEDEAKNEVETPTDTLQDQIKYYFPSILQSKEEDVKNEAKMPTDTLQDQIKYHLPSILQSKEEEVKNRVKTPPDTLQDLIKYYLPSILQSKEEEVKNEVKMPTDTLQDQIKYYSPSILQSKEEEAKNEVKTPTDTLHDQIEYYLCCIVQNKEEEAKKKVKSPTDTLQDRKVVERGRQEEQKHVTETFEQRQEKTEEKKDPKDGFIHGRHTCDSCLVTPIVGKRYHATNLPDHDLCEKCIHNYKGDEIKFQVVELERDRPLQERWRRHQARWA